MPYGRDGTVTDCVDWAVGSPLLLTTWPVKVVVVEVPAVLVTVKETVYTPLPAYVWDVVGEVVVTGSLPSPKFHL